MSADEVDVKVEPADIDAAVEALVEGQRLYACCPVARVLQGLFERRVNVFTASWHFAARDKQPATNGVPLPADAIAFIKKFDAWASAVRSGVRAGRELDDAKAAAAGRPGGIRFSVAVPS